MADQPNLVLYHAAPSRSSIVHWMLEEVGEPFRLELLNLQKGEHLKDDYLAINPMGKVPALRHGDVVITESAAICCYLAETFPAANLAPPIGDPRRAAYLKWLFFGPSCIEPAIIDKASPRAEEPSRGMLGWGNFETVLEVLTAGLQPGPYLLGEQFTAADVVVGSSIRWGMMFNLLPATAEFEAYIARLNARPALQRSMAKDQELAEAAEQA